MYLPRFRDLLVTLCMCVLYTHTRAHTHILHTLKKTGRKCIEVFRDFSLGNASFVLDSFLFSKFPSINKTKKKYNKERNKYYKNLHHTLLLQIRSKETDGCWSCDILSSKIRASDSGVIHCMKRIPDFKKQIALIAKHQPSL